MFLHHYHNLKEKIKSMETKLNEKKNPVYFVEVPKNQEDLKHDPKHSNEIDIDTLKKRESYEDEYQAILKELQKGKSHDKRGCFCRSFSPCTDA
jgi:hypothetical protein